MIRLEHQSETFRADDRPGVQRYPVSQAGVPVHPGASVQPAAFPDDSSATDENVRFQNRVGTHKYARLDHHLRPYRDARSDSSRRVHFR